MLLERCSRRLVLDSCRYWRRRIQSKLFDHSREELPRNLPLPQMVQFNSRGERSWRIRCYRVDWRRKNKATSVSQWIKLNRGNGKEQHWNRQYDPWTHRNNSEKKICSEKQQYFQTHKFGCLSHHRIQKFGNENCRLRCAQNDGTKHVKNRSRISQQRSSNHWYTQLHASHLWRNQQKKVDMAWLNR